MLRKLNNILGIIVENLSWVILSIMTIIVFFQVINRNIFHLEAMWTEEIAKYLFVWSTMLASASATKNREHIIIDMIFQLWPGKTTQIMGTIGDYFHILYYVVLLVATYKWASGFSGIVTDVSRIPVQIFYLMLPACALIMLIAQVVNTLDDINSLKSNKGGE